MRVVFLNPTGNTFVRGQINGLVDANLLAEFHVSIAAFQGSLLDRLGSLPSFSEIRRRRFDDKLKPFTRTFPWLELGRQVSSKMGLSSLSRNESGVFHIDSISKNLDQRLAARLKQARKKGWKAVFGCEDVIAYSFRQAKVQGLQCFYDLPIGYWRTAHRLLQDEKERWPEWASTLIAFNDSEQKLTRKDEELSLADRIFVASSFTAQTLSDYPGKLAPVSIVPYGFPPVTVNSRQYYKGRGDGPLKLLFVGSLSQRKGIANLFAAVEKFKSQVALTVVGYKASENCNALDQALKKHRWIPTLPHKQVLELMREHDVLVFPSLFEGFGLVITEAMAQGTPVITTERTAGPDIIQNDENGWIIEAGSTESLENAIERLLLRPSLISENGHAALATARGRTWETYGRELAFAIESSL